ncbi:MAG: bifunctional DNA-formamidopyrimidine glycosylase/DNA-(apurinic or apyrimidinic site) lyase [Patescibacteria group bacterium]|jgi:formamidopyrimidine-DNA glycosylase
MPELPEVETIRTQLDVVLRNKHISKLEIRVPKLVKSPLTLFKRLVVNSKIDKVGRRAKIILIYLSNKQVLLVHLKMTGQLVYRYKKIIKAGGPARDASRQLVAGGHPIKNGLIGLPNKFSHVIFTFSDGSHLFFNDVRKFGYLKLLSSDELDKYFEDAGTGPEPLSVGFTFQIFQNILSRRKSQKIKPRLMDQTAIAGIGNIYATEACYYAGIKPTRRAGTLKAAEQKKLFQSIKRILRLAVKKQGTTANNYVDAHGEPGKYFPMLRVYGREGEKCRRCGNIIKAMSLGGRGTTYCPVCQK